MDDGQQGSCTSARYLEHAALQAVPLHHPNNPMPWPWSSTVILMLKKIRLINLHNFAWPTELHWMVNKILAAYFLKEDDDCGQGRA